MAFGQSWEDGVWSELGGWRLVRAGRMAFCRSWEDGVWSELGGWHLVRVGRMAFGQSWEDGVNYRGPCLNWLPGLSTFILIRKKWTRNNVCVNEFSN